jgi:hypothetical protein
MMRALVIPVSAVRELSELRLRDATRDNQAQLHRRPIQRFTNITVA